MRSIAIALLALVLLVVVPTPTAAAPLSGYYEHTEQNYVIKTDRSVDAQMNFTLVNTSWDQRIIGANWPIPTADVHENSVRAWDDRGQLETEIKHGEENTVITIKFMGNGIMPHSQLTFHLSFTAGGLVDGSGPQYSTRRLGGLIPTSRHENYVITVQGPLGTRFFLSDNEVEEKLENGFPTVTYMTQLEANEEFEGIRVHFYKEPVYYKLVITESVSNPATKASENIWLDVPLFQLTGSQFAALSASQGELVAMYRGDENKWHGVFGVGTLEPGESRDVDIEMIFMCNIYTSDTNENNTGALSEVQELPSYSRYLQQDKYWEVEHPSIQSKAQDLRGVGDPNTYELAKRIVEFVSDWVETPENENVNVPRYGALWTYQNKYGDCDCFSDLTIALARAAGLPARMCLGWVYREEAPGPHAWVEFYLPRKGWGPADPTWAKTLGNYLCRIDSGRVLQTVWGLESEIYVVEDKWWDGVEPEVKQREVTLALLSEESAPQEFIKAAELAIKEAEKLLGYELTDARSCLSQSNSTDNIAERISLARLALERAYEVIQERGGKPPKRAVPIDLWMVLLVVLVASSVAVAAASTAFWLRRRG